MCVRKFEKNVVKMTNISHKAWIPLVVYNRNICCTTGGVGLTWKL